ncbi:hypothetical protein D3C72_2401800 [compost metagenome]
MSWNSVIIYYQLIVLYLKACLLVSIYGLCVFRDWRIAMHRIFAGRMGSNASSLKSALITS